MSLVSCVSLIIFFIHVQFHICDCVISMNQISNLIDNSSSRNEECERFGNCDFFDNWNFDRETNRFNVECKSDKICILTCKTFEECLNLDVYAQVHSVLIIECIASNACSQLNVNAQNTDYLYVQSNTDNAIIKSQITCPMDESSPCIVNGNCVSNDCRQPILKSVSIYSIFGYDQLELKCDQSQNSNCFDSCFIICGETYSSLQTCWIKYDETLKQYSCDGQQQICKSPPTIQPTLAPTLTNGGFIHEYPTTNPQNEVQRSELEEFMAYKFWVYLSLTFFALCSCILICLAIMKRCWKRNPYQMHTKTSEDETIQPQDTIIIHHDNNNNVQLETLKHEYQNTNSNMSNMTVPDYEKRISSSIKSHKSDGLEAQATKQLFETKLGMKIQQKIHHHTNTNTTTKSEGTSPVLDMGDGFEIGMAEPSILSSSSSSIFNPEESDV